MRTVSGTRRAGYRQDAAEYAHPDPQPTVTVVVEQPDPAAIERIVDERLRERGREQAAPEPEPGHGLGR